MLIFSELILIIVIHTILHYQFNFKLLGSELGLGNKSQMQHTIRSLHYFSKTDENEVEHT